jgi:hypothetical protein
MGNNLKAMKQYIPLLTTAVALLLLAAGILTGEPSDVWQKAVSICLSCIGIG